MRFLHILFFTFFAISGVYGAVVDQNGRVLPEIKTIFKAYKPLWQADFKNADLNDLKTLNAIGQKHFKRPNHLEIKDIVNNNDRFLPYTSKKVWKAFKNIGHLKTQRPSKKPIRYILINGATIQTMRSWIQHLIKITPSLNLMPNSEVVFLTGNRNLFQKELKDWRALNPKKIKGTEADAAKALWQQTPKPPKLQNLKFTLIRAPKKSIKDKHGKIKYIRPSRFDTVNTWINKKPEPGHCLSIANQPYTFYQEQTLRSFFKKINAQKFTVEGVGKGVTKNPPITIMLDNLARTLYTIIKN